MDESRYIEPASYAGISEGIMRTTQLCHRRGRLTVDAERHPGIQFASLGHGPVPHDAAVRSPIVTAGWRQRQDRRGDGVSRIARPRLCLQRVGIALLVPPAHKAYCLHYTQDRTKCWREYGTKRKVMALNNTQDTTSEMLVNSHSRFPVLMGELAMMWDNTAICIR